MRIVVIGQAAFGAKTLEVLLERGETIAGVFTPREKPGGRPDLVKELAAARNIPVFQPATYKSEEVFSQYKALNPDLTILAFVTDIIPPRYFNAARRGAICYHPSLLPRHRGASAINWAVIMGETKTGLTIFWPDGGIDTGPILLQKQIEIGPDDTTGAIYFNHLFPMGVDAIVESVELIKANTAPQIPQDEGSATYEPPCNDNVARIDWLKPARSVYNLVRGCDPQPGAYGFKDGEKIRFLETSLQGNEIEAEPGTILRIAPEGLHVALRGGRLVVGKVRPQRGGKMSASDWAKGKDLEAGDRFDEEP